MGVVVVACGRARLDKRCDNECMKIGAVIGQSKESNIKFCLCEMSDGKKKVISIDE